MIQEEKAKRHDAIINFRDRFSSMFDGQGNFKLHEDDVERAKELLKFALSEKIDFKEIKEIALGYFEDSGLSEEIILKQKPEVFSYFKLVANS